MTIPDDNLSTQMGTTPEHLAIVLAQAVAALPAPQVYVFRAPPGSTSGPQAPTQPRTVLAFVSADDALTWAQRNGAGPQVRVRMLAAGGLLQQMLATAGIGRVLFLQGMHADTTGRTLPPGIAITREQLIEQLHAA